MFGLTTTRRLRAEQHKTLGLHTRLGLLQGFRDADIANARRCAEQDLAAEIDAHLATIRQALAAEQATAEPRPVKHPDELWSLIDWTLWGSGMGDAFREHLADTFFQAITTEDHAQALELIRWWTEDRGREPLGRRRYEDLKRRLNRALANVVRWRQAAHAEKRRADQAEATLHRVRQTAERLAGTSGLGVDLEADGIRRSIADWLFDELDNPGEEATS
ncbi:hypothetical protein ACIOHA_15900 [Streptomyces anulatus]